MSKAVIRVGDPTDHGGKVLASSVSHYTVSGIAVAVVGDPVSCPKKGHVNCKIVSGNARHTIDGKPVAYEGDKVSCGATLISTAHNYTIT
jgi:uncharacterized Zn-binding protein involved in type VI secretion